MLQLLWLARGRETKHSVSITLCFKFSSYLKGIIYAVWDGLNATTGEHVDVSDLGRVGAQLNLVMAIKATGKKTIAVYVSGRPVAEPWIAARA